MNNDPLAITDTTPHADTRPLALGFVLAVCIYLVLPSYGLPTDQPQPKRFSYSSFRWLHAFVSAYHATRSVMDSRPPALDLADLA
jgi:hypothetical protein